MRNGVFWVVFGFIVAVCGAIFPIIGWPVMLVGVVMMVWGATRFWFGVGAAVVKGGAKAVGATSKTGTGRL